MLHGRFLGYFVCRRISLNLEWVSCSIHVLGCTWWWSWWIWSAPTFQMRWLEISERCSSLIWNRCSNAKFFSESSYEFAYVQIIIMFGNRGRVYVCPLVLTYNGAHYAPRLRTDYNTRAERNWGGRPIPLWKCWIDVFQYLCSRFLHAMLISRSLIINKNTERQIEIRGIPFEILN